MLRLKYCVGLLALGLLLTSMMVGGTAAQEGSKTLILDVFHDATTFVASNTSTIPPPRGSTFILTGYVYPGGTIKDSASFNPADHTTERIGTIWSQGTFTGNEFEVFVTHEYFLPDNSNAIVVEGGEGAGPTSSSQLAVVGGTGEYNSRGGYVTITRLGYNISGLLNSRSEFHFSHRF